MRYLKLMENHITFDGIATHVQLLDSKFESGNRVSVRLQPLNSEGENVGPEKELSGPSCHPASLHSSTNSLVASYFGNVSDTTIEQIR